MGSGVIPAPTRRALQRGYSKAPGRLMPGSIRGGFLEEVRLKLGHEVCRRRNSAGGQRGAGIPGGKHRCRSMGTWNSPTCLELIMALSEVVAVESWLGKAKGGVCQWLRTGPGQPQCEVLKHGGLVPSQGEKGHLGLFVHSLQLPKNSTKGVQRIQAPWLEGWGQENKRKEEVRLRKAWALRTAARSSGMEGAGKSSFPSWCLDLVSLPHFLPESV